MFLKKNFIYIIYKRLLGKRKIVSSRLYLFFIIVGSLNKLKVLLAYSIFTY